MEKSHVKTTTKNLSVNISGLRENRDAIPQCITIHIITYQTCSVANLFVWDSMWGSHVSKIDST